MTPEKVQSESDGGAVGAAAGAVERVIAHWPSGVWCSHARVVKLARAAQQERCDSGWLADRPARGDQKSAAQCARSVKSSMYRVKEHAKNDIYIFFFFRFQVK